MSYFTVKKIISSEKVELNNGLQVRLLGIKEDKTKNGKAVSYLEDNIKGKKVFLKYDEIKHDKENNLLCYLYLENKTFVNTHLLKNQLAGVDEGSNFKYKEKFLSLLKG
jgi:site-specific DNA-methyltransferase (adenine-specific)